MIQYSRKFCGESSRACSHEYDASHPETNNIVNSDCISLTTRDSISECIQVELAKLPPEAQLTLALLASSTTEATSIRIQRLLDDKVDWKSFYFWLDRHGVVPLVHRRIKALAPEGIPNHVIRQLAAHDLYNATRASQQVDEILRLAELFTQSDMPMAILKGSILSSEIYNDPTVRQVGDIDILIDPQYAVQADRILRQDGKGAASSHDGLSPGQLDRYISRGAGFCYYHPWQTELHCHMPVPKFGIAVDNPLAKRRGIEEINVLVKEDRLLHLCQHGAKHGWSSLKWLTDIDQILCHHADLDWGLLWSRATEQGSGRMLTQGLLLASLLLGAPLPDGFEMQRAWRMPRAILITPLRYLAKQAEPITLLEYILYQARLREPVDSLYYVTKQIIIPTPSDWSTVRLPDALYPLYYPLRPFLWLRRKILPF